jgi:hypothetical protein
MFSPAIAVTTPKAACGWRSAPWVKTFDAIISRVRARSPLQVSLVPELGETLLSPDTVHLAQDRRLVRRQLGSGGRGKCQEDGGKR